LLGLSATAQDLTQANYDAPWQISSYANEAGLTRQRVLDIDFAADGTAWIAADDGLRRFDGFTWQSFGTNTGLPTTFARAVHVDLAGNIWLGSDAGAGTFDEKHSKYNPHNSAANLANSNVREIEQDPDGTFWFCCDEWPEAGKTPGGLTQWQNGSWSTFHKTNGLPMDYVTGYFRDSTGRQFVLTPHGWAQRQDDRWTEPVNPGYEVEDCVLQMAEAPDGSLFAQGEHSLLHLKDGRWQVCLGNHTRLVGSTREGELVALEYDELKSQIWFSLWNGERFIKSSAAVSCPSDSRFYRLREAPDGSIWAVGFGTIVRWSFHAGPWTSYPKLPAPRGLDTAGRIWFGDESNILFSLSNQFQILPPGNFKLLNPHGRALIEDNVTHQLLVTDLKNPQLYLPIQTGCETIDLLRADEADGFWIVGRDKQFDAVIAHFQAGKTTVINPPEFHGHRLMAATAEGGDKLWLVAQKIDSIDYSLALVQSNQVAWQTLEPEVPTLTYPAWSAGGGSCWLAGYAGLYQQFPMYNGPWRQVTAFPDGGFDHPIVNPHEILFIFSGGRTGHPGCALYFQNKWQIAYGDLSKPLYGPDQSTIYLPSYDGVYIRRQIGTLDFEHLKSPDGERISIAMADPTGDLWLGNSEGTLRYQPSRTPPTTRISSPATETRIGKPLPVVFQGMLRFHHVTAPDAFHYDAFHYSWRIDNGSWSAFVPWPGENLALPTLPAGQHSLQVRSRDVDGNVQREPTVMAFTVLPVPLQQRIWFWPVVGILTIVIAWLIWLQGAYVRQIGHANAALRAEIKIRRQTEKELQHSREELENRVTERTTELTQANESLNREIGERQLAQESRQKLEAQLHQSQKMEAIGTLAGGIAHDFNNILAVIIPYCYVIKDEIPERPDLQENLDQVLHAANRAKNLVQQILTFSRRQTQERQIIDLQPVLKETLKLLRSALPSTVQIIQKINPAPPVLADPTQMHQVIMNLCVNAEHAMVGQQGSLEVGLNELILDEAFCKQNTDLRPGHYVCLSVKDNGCGMTPEVQRRIFEPFFTTKDTGKGTGLGLAVVHGIVKNHHGAVLVESRPGQGSKFLVFFPAQQEKASSTTTPNNHLHLARGEEILIVDDETALVEILEIMLTRAGYKVSAHNNPLAALRDFMTRPTDIDLVISDLTMPGMNGMDLAKKIYKIRPELPIAITTGYSGDLIAKSEISAQPNVRKVVEKPLNPDQILQIITELLPIKPTGIK
jgi:signal transduction histidine kinase/CheY-like chemotaxis protein